MCIRDRDSSREQEFKVKVTAGHVLIIVTILRIEYVRWSPFSACGMYDYVYCGFYTRESSYYEPRIFLILNIIEIVATILIYTPPF